jgi:hypothetical protein
LALPCTLQRNPARGQKVCVREGGHKSGAVVTYLLTVVQHHQGKTPLELRREVGEGQACGGQLKRCSHTSKELLERALWRKAGEGDKASRTPVGLRYCAREAGLTHAAWPGKRDQRLRLKLRQDRH